MRGSLRGSRRRRRSLRGVKGVVKGFRIVDRRRIISRRGGQPGEIIGIRRRRRRRDRDRGS